MKQQNANYYQAKARSVDTIKKEVCCEGLFDDEKFVVKFDKLVIATGMKTNTFRTRNVNAFEGRCVFFLKQLNHARALRDRTIEMFEVANYPGTSPAEKKRLLSFVIVGGGPTSCEYAAGKYSLDNIIIVILNSRFTTFVFLTS